MAFGIEYGDNFSDFVNRIFYKYATTEARISKLYDE